MCIMFFFANALMHVLTSLSDMMKFASTNCVGECLAANDTNLVVGEAEVLELRQGLLGGRVQERLHATVADLV